VGLGVVHHASHLNHSHRSPQEPGILAAGTGKARATSWRLWL